MRFAAWVEAERGRLALFLPVAMVVGDLAYFALDQEPALWLVGVTLLLSVVGAGACRRWLVPRAIAWLALAAALGFASAAFATWRAPPMTALPRRAAIISGTVALIEALPEGRRVTLAQPRFAEAEPIQRVVRIRLRRDDPVAVDTGDGLRVRALVRPPAPPSYPGAWDLQRDAWFHGLAGYGYALGAATVVSTAQGGGLAGMIADARARIAGRALAMVPGAEGAISAVLLTGLPAAIPDADRAAFRGSGLAHLLAIAGLHIGIVMALVMGVFRRALVLSERAALFWPVKQLAGVAALAAGGSYALLTGLHVPILRSFAMASLVVIGLLVGRRAVSLRALALAAAVIVIVAPEEAVGVSFQMSFAAVLALISGYAALRPLLRRLHGTGWWRRITSHIVALALTSLLAGAASAPFAAYHFGQIQLYFIIANVFAVPLTAFWVMPAGMLSLILLPVGLDQWPFWAMGQGVHIVLWIARTVAAWPAATLSVPHMAPWGLALVASGMAWLGLCRSRGRLAGIAFLLLGLISPALVAPADLLISADARTIAVHTQQGVFAQTGAGADRFVKEAFAQYWGVRDLAELDDPACQAGACVLRPRPDAPAALLLRPPGRNAPCQEGLVVISAEPIGDVCQPLARIDRFTVWREGAQAIWLAPLYILSDKAWRGHRPWVMLPGDTREAVGLPMAQTE
jgi:competence protein ComEC